MSHVDEGLIHAYLDGAFAPGNEQGAEIERHLEVCVDCRVRLEKARELKDRAQLVMHVLAPARIAKPSFEEIVARRERERAAEPVAGAAAAEPSDDVASRREVRRRSSVPAIPLAWAASVVLAIGAGWMAREYLWAPRLAETAMESAESVAGDAASVSPEAESAPAAPPATAENGLPRTQAAPMPAMSGRAFAADEDSGAGRTTGVPPAERTRQANEALAAAAPAAQKAAADAARQRLEEIVVSATPTPIQRRQLSAAVSNLAAAPVARVVDLSDSASTADAALREYVSLLRDYVRATAEEEWTTVPAYEVPGRIGFERPAQIEGLEPVRVEESGAEAAPLRRTVYELEDGTTVELIHRLDQVEVALDEIVVTGVMPLRDSAEARARIDSAARRVEPQARADSTRRAEAPAAPPQPSAPEGSIETVSAINDARGVLAGASIVVVQRDDRLAMLIGRHSEDVLRALAERVR